MPNNCIVTYNTMPHTLFCPFSALPCAQVVTACAILHNICVRVGDDQPPEDAALEEDNQPPTAHQGGGESESGAAWRPPPHPPPL